jgi:Ca2+-dependent lipid-binding protein
MSEPSEASLLHNRRDIKSADMKHPSLAPAPAPALADEVVQEEEEEEVCGKLEVHVQDATGLSRMDTFTRKADPYVQITLTTKRRSKGGVGKGEEEERVTLKTSCKKKTLEPKWSETLSWQNCVVGASLLSIEMFDQVRSSSWTLLPTPDT